MVGSIIFYIWNLINITNISLINDMLNNTNINLINQAAVVSSLIHDVNINS